MVPSGHLWHLGVVEGLDNFGTALGVGDFNGDGADDLAIGVPMEDISSITNQGMVHILYGSSTPPQVVPFNMCHYF